MKKRILMLDDDDELTEVLGRALALEEEWEFHSADSAAAGLRKLDDVRPDVLLLDYDLGPGQKSGLEFLREIRRHPRCRGLPVILFTGVMVDAVERAAGLDLGADDYVLKPVSPPVLPAKAGAALRREGRKPLKTNSGLPPLAGLWVLAAAPFLLPGAAAAGVSQGGAYALEAAAAGPGGEASGGRWSARLQAPAFGAAGAAELPARGGYLRYFYALEVSSFAAAESPLLRGGQQFGIDEAAPVEIGFNISISSPSLLAATTVYLVYDRLANPRDEPVPYELSYDTATYKARIEFPTGWENGNTYRVVVGTAMVDLAGSPLPAEATLTFQSLLDFSLENVVRAQGDEKATVRLPPGGLGGKGFVVFHADPLDDPDRADPGQIVSANAKASANLGDAARPVAILEVNAYSASGGQLDPRFAEPALLAVPFEDADADGLVDAQAGQVRARQLSLWVLEEKSGSWVRVPGSSVDPAAGLVTAPLQHFSVYAVMAVPDTNVSLAHPYPVPWRPHGGDPARYGTLAGGVTFVDLPQVGSIRLYTLTGLLVREQPLSGALQWVWDGRNKDGEAVASGTYLWMVEADGNVKTGKLIVIR